MNTYDRIKELAQEHRMSIAELERTLNLSNGSISKWATAKPNSKYLEVVADYFDVSTDYLLGRTDIRNMSNSRNTKSDKVDLSQTNIFSYRGDEMDVDGIDPEDWEIIKAVLARAQKNKEDGK